MLRYKAIIPYPEIVKREGLVLQKGMNFRVKHDYSIILMSVRRGAPYSDKWHQETGTLEYEGHDQPRRAGVDPKEVDQVLHHKHGSLTENGKFYEFGLGVQAEKRATGTGSGLRKDRSGNLVRSRTL